MVQRKVIYCYLLLLFNMPSLLVAKTPAATVPPVVVEAVVVAPHLSYEQVTVPGTLVAIPGIVVKPEVAGRITKICFKSGDLVAAGTPLIELNAELLRARLEEAQAQANLAHLQFERYAALVKTHDVSKADFDKVQARYKAALATVAHMQAQLRQLNITAPFAGKLGLSQVSVGDYVSAGQSLVNLQTLDPLKVDFSIPESYVSKVAVGQTVLLYTDAYPKEQFKGTVEAVEVLLNHNNRTLNVRATVANREHKLLPGIFAEVTVQLTQPQKVIRVPQSAVIYAVDGNYVFKVVAGQAVRTPVILGKRDVAGIIIKKGVEPGEQIIITGQLKVRPGSAVIVAKAKNTEIEGNGKSES